LALVVSLCAENGSQTFAAGIGREARNRLWEARHQLGELLFRLHPGQSFLISDVAVPISQYPALVASATEALGQLEGVSGYIFGHAGDGNMHSMISFPADDAAAFTRVQAGFNDYVVNKAISLGGTCTGEHGVGIGKQKYMVYEHGEVAIGVMRQLKATFDPNGILNPGKIVG
jgi:D-lactate dehydrogenase (cytochrome)